MIDAVEREPLEVAAVPRATVSTPPPPVRRDGDQPEPGPPPGEDLERVVVFSESGVTVEVPHNYSILEAGLEAGVDLMFSCTLGGCGACMLQIVEGEVEYDEPESICLTEAEVEEGYCLVCVGRPRGRVVLEG